VVSSQILTVKTQKHFLCNACGASVAQKMFFRVFSIQIWYQQGKRDLTNERWLEALTIATQQVPQDEIEAANWQARLFCDAAALPFPVA